MAAEQKGGLLPKIRNSAWMLFCVTASVMTICPLANTICKNSKPNNATPEKCEIYNHYAAQTAPGLTTVLITALAITLVAEVLRRVLAARSSAWK